MNRLFTRKHHKLRYLTYPLLKERAEYLQIWEDKGAATQTLRDIAAYQLHLIDYLHVEDRRMVSIEDIRESADSWMTVQRCIRDIRKKTFYIIYYQLVVLYGSAYM